MIGVRVGGWGEGRNVMAHHNPAGHCERRNTRPVCVGGVFSGCGLRRRWSERSVCHHDVRAVGGRAGSGDSNNLLRHLINIYLLCVGGGRGGELLEVQTPLVHT